MAITRRRKMIGSSGIALTVLTDCKLKTNSFLVHFISELTEENAAAYASCAFMLEDSCREYPTITDFGRRLAELYGANVRCGVSRFSDSRTVTFAASCISDRYALEGEEVSYELLKLLCGCIFEPVTENGSFPEKQFALKKQELIDDIDADINDKRLYALKQAGRTVYKGEPAGIAVKGERSAAISLTADKAFEAYKEMLCSSKIEIFFVGNELTEKCERLIEEKFSAIERKNVHVPEIVFSKLKESAERITDRLDIVQSKMVMAYKTDLNDRAVSRVFTAVFGSTPFSMLFKNVREKLSLCYYCAASVNAKKQVMYIDSGVESGNIEAAQAEIIRQLEAVARGEFSDELLSQAKLSIICALKAVNDYPRSVADWYFADCMLDESEIKSPEDVIAEIEKVTREDVAEYAAHMKLDTVYVLTGKEEA